MRHDARVHGEQDFDAHNISKPKEPLLIVAIDFVIEIGRFEV
jgi:hypothetical protein